MTGLDILFLCVTTFGAGMVFGAMLLIHQAMRPQGYIAGNGKRVRLVVE
jgi:hypothetical protein